MRHIARALALTLAAFAAANAVATDDFRVVVPLYGKKAVKAGIELQPSDLPLGTVGQPYPDFDFNTLVQVTGDKPFDSSAVTWSVLSPLPDGLELTAAGQLKGVPTLDAIASPPFTVRATYEGKSAAQNYSVSVSDDTPQPPETGGEETIADDGVVLTVKPTKLSFGLVARQLPTPPLKVNISNTGTKAATLTIGKPEFKEFTLTHTCQAELAPGTSCEAAVVFTPQTEKGQSSAFGIGLGQKSVSVTMSGSGRNSEAQLTHLPWKQSYQDFGIVAAGQFVARQTVLKNISKYYALGIFDAKPAPGYNGSDQFALDAAECPQVLPVGESCVVTERFVPTKEGTYSTYGRLTMNVYNNRRDFNMYGRAAGELALTRLSHANAYLAGGQQLTLYGKGILPGAKVLFGETEAATRDSGTTMMYATVPAVAEPENTYVRIVNPDGAEASAPTLFKRADFFGELSVKGPMQFGKQALNVPSQWQYFQVKNMAAFSSDTLDITDIQVTGPYQIDTSQSYCAVGRKIGYGGNYCTMRIRFLPTEAGDMPGAITVVARGGSLSLPLAGLGLAWDGTPSGSATENTDLPYSSVLSGNEAVGGASQTKLVDIYFRNINPDAQLNAVFQIADGSAFKLYSVASTNGTDTASANCLASSGAKTTSLCRADVGSGKRPHLWVRLQVTSAAGLGTQYDELVVQNAAGEEQFRIPLWLDVVYDVTAAPFADRVGTTPLSEVYAENIQLAQEGFRDFWVANIGTHGMLRTDALTVVDSNSSDIYLKADSLIRTSPAVNTTSTGTCGRFVSATEFVGCLSDDIAGPVAGQTAQRVRLYYKPMTSGARTATLRLTHRGQGSNPLDIPVTIKPVVFNGVFSANPAAQAQADVPVARIPANYEVNKLNVNKPVYVYLNSADGQPLKGVLRLSGPGTEDTRVSFAPGMVNATASNNAGCTTKSRLESNLCGGNISYPHMRYQVTINTAIGAGVYNWKLSFLDPALNELASVPLQVELVNDAQPEVSASHNTSSPLPDGVLDFGKAGAPLIAGQTVPAVNKLVYLRNLGTIGMLKVTNATIEGGDGAFTFANMAGLIGDNEAATAFTWCGSKTDAYNIVGCPAQDPSVTPGVHTHFRFTLNYAPTAAGLQTAVLKVWHTSTTVPNPLVIPLAGTGMADPVAGELSSSAISTISPTGKVPTISSWGTSTLSVFVRNTDAYSGLYAEEITVEGAEFRLGYIYRAVNNSGSGVCSTIAADGKSAAPCAPALPTPAGTSPMHIRIDVQCSVTTSTPKGLKTGTLRVKTRGAEHILPLNCTKI